MLRTAPLACLLALCLAATSASAADPRQELHMAGTLDQYRSQKAISDLEKGATVEALGPGSVGGQPAQMYRFLMPNDKRQSITTVWVGDVSGLVLQAETTGKQGSKAYWMRMAYTDFNSRSIRINAPQ